MAVTQSVGTRESLNVKARGTLGLLLRAVRCDLRSADEVLALLASIPDRTSLHIKPQLLEEVIAQARQEWLK